MMVGNQLIFKPFLALIKIKATRSGGFPFRTADESRKNETPGTKSNPEIGDAAGGMRTNLEIYRSITEQAADSIFVTDARGCIAYLNPEARRMFGYSDEEIVGHTVNEILHHHFPNGDPCPPDKCHVYLAATSGETTRDFTWVMFRKDGSTFHASCTASPLYLDGHRQGAVLFVTDITERRRVEDALLKSAEKLRLATEVTGIGLFEYFPKSGEIIWTEALKRLFGLPREAVVTYDVFLRGLHPDDRDRVDQLMREALRGGGNGRYHAEYRTIGIQDGKERWVSATGQTYFTDDGEPIRMIGSAMDITERKLSEKRAREASQHDSLTGLPNRALLFEYCSHLLAMAGRHSTGGAVLFIDLDRFKAVNDLYGHDVGDKLLQEVARRLQMCVRREDIVSRLGGDEFIVVLPRANSGEASKIVAQNILKHIGQPFDIGTLALSVSPSIGISLFPTHSDDLETLIRCADLAMYAAKKQGRNNFQFYSPGLDERANDRLRMEMRLKRALEEDGMELVYQPIVDIDTGRLAGIEALARLPLEEGGAMHPDEFIPIAESAGLIDRLGEWVAAEACSQYRRWREAGLPPVDIAINISNSQLRHRALATHLANTIRAAGIEPSHLQIEVSESAVMENLPETTIALNNLKALGIRIALDDFGTGYSNLSSLSHLPLDKLKIDQSFVRRIDQNETNRLIADAIIGLGRSLKLQVVGEGIESEQAMHYLREHGCDEAQGYLLSRPLPARDFEAWFRRHLRSQAMPA
jgi:diguanylate cyclase (GGDEF)-like protein/PAS domain S-box-containing protein